MTTPKEKLRELAEKATPGPYMYSVGGLPRRHTIDAMRNGGMGEVVAELAWHRSDTDAAFIAACDPQTILGLLEEIARLHDCAEKEYQAHVKERTLAAMTIGEFRIANEVVKEETVKAIVAYLRSSPAPCGGECVCGCCEAASDAIERGEWRPK